MARQATLGMDGTLRFSINIPARIGRAELVAAVSYFRGETDSLPETRTDAKRLARDYLAKYGAQGTPHPFESPSPARQTEIGNRIDELFPDLSLDRDDRE